MHLPNTLHPKALEALDGIDACMFSGDTFHREQNLAVLEFYLERWNKEAEKLRAELVQPCAHENAYEFSSGLFNGTAKRCPDCGATKSGEDNPWHICDLCRLRRD